MRKVELMRLLILLLSLSLVSCTSIRQVSQRDPNFGGVIGRAICTTNGTYIKRWERSSVEFYEQEQFRLNALPGETLDDWTGIPRETYDEYKSLKPFANDRSILESETLLPIGTGFEIKKVFFTRAFHGRGYRVMATVNGFSLEGKLVDISYLFGFNRPYILNNRLAEFCE